MRRDAALLGLCAVWFVVLAARGLDYGLPQAGYSGLLFQSEEGPQVLPQVAAIREADRQRTESYKAFWGWKLIPPPEYLSEITREEPWMLHGQVKYRSVNKLKWIGAQLLNSQVPDEQFIMHAISQMQPRRLDFNPRFFSYGGAYVFAVAASLGLGQMAGLVQLTPDRLFYLSQPEQVQRLFLIGKWLGVIAGLLLIILVYLAGRRLVSRTAGLCAAALASSYPAYVVEAHHLKPFLWSGCWVLVVLWAFTQWQQQAARRWLVLSGVAAGLAAGTCYISGAIIAIPLAQLLWQARASSSKRGGALRAAGLLVAVSLVTFLGSNPYLLTSWPILASNIRNLSYQNFGRVHYLDLSLHRRIFEEMAISLGVFGTVCAVIGLLVAAWRWSRADRWILGGFLLFYLLAFKAIAFADPVHHLVPMMALPLLLCVRWIPEAMQAKRVLVRVLGGLLMAATVVDMGWLGWRYSGLYAGPSPSVTAGAWINTHVTAGAPIGSWIHDDGVRYGYPLFHYLDYRFVHDADPNLSTLRSTKPEYLIAIIRPDTPEPLLAHPDVLREYRLAARFALPGAAAFPDEQWKSLVDYVTEEVRVYRRDQGIQQLVLSTP